MFRGGSDWIIYPHDFEPFKMEIIPHTHDSTEKRLYQFTCTVWSEGLEDSTTTQEFEVIISEPE